MPHDSAVKIDSRTRSKSDIFGDISKLLAALQFFKALLAGGY